MDSLAWNNALAMDILPLEHFAYNIITDVMGWSLEVFGKVPSFKVDENSQ